jgi:hypothetical protein
MTDGREDITEGPEMQKWNEGPRRKSEATSEEREDTGRIFRKTAELEIEKRIFGSSTGLREVSD